MALPAGVTSGQATIKAPVSFGGTPAKVYLEVVANVSLNHIATGTPIAAFIDVRTPGEGQTATVTLPHTNQSGFQDESGAPVTNWSYAATIRYELDGQLIHIPTKNFALLSGQSTIDLALIPVGTASEPIFGNVAFVSSINGESGVVTLDKTDVGLANVDNTSDAAKPISTATSTALALKAPIASPTFTGTVGGITKTMVGLANVDNTSDAAKPVSTATSTALALKANLASPTFTGTVGGITKSMVGLSNVDNTSDAAKPISTAEQTALDLKAPIASPTFTGTVGGITKTMVGLGNVDNTSDANKPLSTATTNALAAKSDIVRPVTTVTATTTLATTDLITLVNSTGATTITLPDPTTVAIGREYIIKNINTGTVTVATAGSGKTIDGSATASVAQNARSITISNGTQWFKVD